MLFSVLNREIERRLDSFKAELFSSAEEWLGYGLSYSSVSPSLMRHLEVRDLRIFNKDTGQDLLYINKLRIFYSFTKFFGTDPVSAVKEISIENTTVNYEPDNQLTPEFLNKLISGNEELSNLPSINISGKNLSLYIETDGTEIYLEKLFFNIIPDKNEYTFKIHGKAAAFLEDEYQGMKNIDTEFSASGIFDHELTRADTSITLKNLRSELFKSNQISFQVKWRDTSVSIRKIQDRAPYNLFINLNTKTKTAEMEFTSENFIPSNHFSLDSQLTSIGPWLNVGFSGRISLELSIETKTLTYDTNIMLKIPTNELVPLPVEADLMATGDLNKIQISRLNVISRRGEAFFIGEVDFTRDLPLPSGSMKLKNIEVQDKNISGMFYLNRQNRYFTIHSPWIMVDELNLENTEIRLIGDLDNVDVFLETSTSDVAWNNSLFFEGNFTMGEEPFFQLLIESFSFPVEPVANLFLEPGQKKISEELKNFTLDTQGFFSTDLEKFSFNASRFELINRETPEEHLSLTVSGNNNGLSFRSLDFMYEGVELSGEGSTSWTLEDQLQFSTRLLFEETPYLVEGTWEPGISLQFQGDYELMGTIVFQESASYFSVEAADFPIPYKDKLYHIDLDSRGDFKSITNWHLLVNEIFISDIPLDPEKERVGTVALSGRFSPLEGQIYKIEYEDDYAPLEGNGEFIYSIAERSSPFKGWIQLFNPDSEESYSIDFEAGESILSGNLAVNDFPLARFGETSMKGFLSGEIGIGGTPDSPEIEIEAGLREGRYNEVPVQFTTKGSMFKDEIVLERLNLAYLNQGVEINSGIYLLKQGKLSLNGAFSGALKENPVSADLQLNINLPVLDEDVTIIDLPYLDWEGNLLVEEIYIFDQKKDSWNMEIFKGERRITFNGGPEQAISGYYDLDSGFNITAAQPLPMNFSISGTLGDGMIEAELDNILMSFDTIEKYFKIPGFTLMSGEARGALLVTGPINDPDLFGALDVSNLTAKLGIMQEPLTLNKTTIKAYQKTLTIENLIVKATEGEAILNCEFILDHLTPFSYKIDLETIYNRDPYLEFIFPNLLIEGYARGIMLMEGDLNVFKVSGDIEVSSGQITLDPDTEKGSSSMEIQVDLGITIGNNNTFYWPSPKFPILKAYAEGGSHLLFNSDSVKGVFSLKGSVGVKGGEIFYFRRNFYLQDGILVFNENQDRFDPSLDARAVIREVDKNGELVKIYLIADKTSLLNFSPRFESDPLRTNQEIVTMLGSNLFNSDESEVLLEDAILLTSDVVSQFGFFQGLEDSVKTNLGLDVFSLRSQIVPNLILERFLPSETEINDTSFARYLDNTTLFIGKYLGRDLFLQSVIQMDYYGNTVDDLYFYPDFNIDTEITLEWKSPVALIEFSLYPDFFDTSDSLLTSSLRLSWSFSF